MLEKNSTFFNDWNLLINSILSHFDQDSKNVLIQSGHFSILFNQNGILIPAIKEEIFDEKLKRFVTDSNYMNDFPFVTFKNGIRLASELKSKDKNVKFAFIVNDWQWINKGLYLSKTDRFKFFRKHTLPKIYNRLLKEYKFNNSDIIRANHFVDKGIYFSEHKLRKVGKKKISNCSPNSCAIEYQPFLNCTLINFDTLVSFIPMSCKIPVLYSACNFINNQTRKIDLFHVFYDPITKEIELSFLNKNNLNNSTTEKINEQFKIMELMSK